MSDAKKHIETVMKNSQAAIDHAVKSHHAIVGVDIALLVAIFGLGMAIVFFGKKMAATVRFVIGSFCVALVLGSWPILINKPLEACGIGKAGVAFMILLALFAAAGGLFLVYFDWLALFACGCVLGYFAIHPTLVLIEYSMGLCKADNTAATLQEVDPNAHSWSGMVSFHNVHDFKWQDGLRFALIIIFSLVGGFGVWAMRDKIGNVVVAFVAAALTAGAFGEICVLIGLLFNGLWTVDPSHTDDADKVLAALSEKQGNIWSWVFHFRLPLPFMFMRQVPMQMTMKNIMTAIQTNSEKWAQDQTSVESTDQVKEKVAADLKNIGTRVADKFTTGNFTQNIAGWIIIGGIAVACAVTCWYRLMQAEEQEKKTAKAEEEERLLRRSSRCSSRAGSRRHSRAGSRRHSRAGSRLSRRGSAASLRSGHSISKPVHHHQQHHVQPVAYQVVDFSQPQYRAAENLV